MKQDLKTLYISSIIPNLQKKFQYSNMHEIPKIIKIVINRGLGDTIQNTKLIENSINELKLITGQKPITTYAKKSIAGFKVRENSPIGVTLTLRRKKMYDFFNKLINLALPRIRDFRGISRTNFDGQGNYNLGIKEQLIFPEIEYEKVNKVHGMDISIVTSAKSDQESYALLKAFGMPFYN